MFKMLIGLTGERGVGKSTIIDYLCDKHDFYDDHSFAPGKMMAHTYFVYCGASEREAERMVSGDLKDIPSSYLPNNATPRFFMEELGKFMGVTLGVDWTLGIVLKRQKEKLYTDRLVLDSVVYEADYFRSKGGIIIRVERPDADTSIQAHKTSEFQKTIKEDYTIFNDGSIEKLHETVDLLIHAIENRSKADSNEEPFQS